ncbi:hypothetical protein LTR56_010708 [Elasticomyces elasticus]|nr:hypothetical protein LTR56_010708 [Elasticomyces elasticus]KAK3655358.1 hypothetical protein LTR22_010243 [Elasticomyces elasticus]KAK4922092.1 hypothetical protein LTR49_010503 [Elasticomyces elasticus]KAK5750973.1 hypothetical protein LTS12_018963 [Elasticomyces elasticus]
MPGYLFITAADVDDKKVNLILLSLRDWYDSDEDDWDGFYLVKSRVDLHVEMPMDAEYIPMPTSPPVPPMIYDGWTGASIAEVERFVTDQALNHRVHGINNTMYLLVDEQGMMDRTCVLGEQTHDWTDDGAIDYNKVRLPWVDAYMIFATLEFANESFAECCNMDVERDSEGWWKYESSMDGPDPDDEKEKLKEATIEQFRRDGRL